MPAARVTAPNAGSSERREHAHHYRHTQNRTHLLNRLLDGRNRRGSEQRRQRKIASDPGNVRQLKYCLQHRGGRNCRARGPTPPQQCAPQAASPRTFGSPVSSTNDVVTWNRLACASNISVKPHRSTRARARARATTHMLQHGQRQLHVRLLEACVQRLDRRIQARPEIQLRSLTRT